MSLYFVIIKTREDRIMRIMFLTLFILTACFLSQMEPTEVSEALEEESWVKAMQEELLQFKLQKFWVLVDLSSGAKVIG